MHHEQELYILLFLPFSVMLFLLFFFFFYLALPPMDNNIDNIVIVYFNDSIITNREYGAIFMCDKLAYFFISQTMLFEELNVGFCQDINVST